MEHSEQLVTAMAQGDERALKQLIERYGRQVWHTAWMLLGDSDAADDVEQETFIRLWQQAKRFRGQATVGGWLHRVACNLCFGELRRRRRHRVFLRQLPAEPVADAASEQLDANDLQRLLHCAIQQLPTKQQAVYVLREVEELSTSEVAEALDLSTDQVKANLYRAKQKVINYLKQYGIQ